MENRWQRARENHVRDHVRLLLDTARALSREPSLEALFERLYELISERLDTTTFFIAFDSPAEDALQIAYYVNEDERNYDPPLLKLTESVSGEVFRSGEPLLINTAEEFDRHRTVPIGTPGTTPPCSAIFAPLRVGDRIIGVISTQSYDEHAYDRNAFELLVAIAEQTTIAIENAKHLRQIEQQSAEMELLVDVARGLASDEFSLEQMCRRIRDQLRSLMDAYCFFVVLLSEDGTTFRTEYCVEGDLEHVVDDHPTDATLAGSIMASREELLLRDASVELRGRRFDFIGDTSALAGSLIMVPLCVGDRAIGAISVQSAKVGAFDEPALRIVRSIAGQLALAIKNVQLYQATERRVDRDGLTNLFNRRYAMRRLTEELDRAQRHGTHVGVAMLDMDGLKRINDTFGHAAGDAAIRALAETLLRACRSSDIVARYGGDEFIVVMPDLRSDEMQPAIRRIRSELERAAAPLAPGVTTSLNASIGIAASDGGSSAADLIAEADSALYLDKISRTRRVS